MKSSNSSRLRNWSRYGAVFGIIIAIADFTGWRGQNYVPWGEAGGTITNISYIIGATIGGTFLFLLAALVVSLFARD